MQTAEKQKQMPLLLVDDDAELSGMMKEYFAETSHHLGCAHIVGIIRIGRAHCPEVATRVRLPFSS
jgi:hypothetical protein